MSKNKKIAIGGLIVLILLATAYLIYYFQPGIEVPYVPEALRPESKKAASQLPAGNNGNTIPNQAIPAEIATTTEPPPVSGELEAKRAAATFAERWGTYSNHSNYANIRELDIMMTEAMKVEAGRQIELLESQAKDYSRFFAIVTKAALTEIVEFEESAGLAKIKVSTSRRETRDDVDGPVFTQSLDLDLVKSDGVWKVSRAVWGVPGAR